MGIILFQHRLGVRDFLAFCPSPPVLSDSVQVAYAGALHRERLSSWLPGPVEANQPVGAFF